MKHLAIIITVLLMVSFITGCGGGTKRAPLPKKSYGNIAVLSMGADTSALNDEQIAWLQHTLNWMDRDMLKHLKRIGLKTLRIKNEKDFDGTGYLFKIAITDHKMTSMVARHFAGHWAGKDRLKAHYTLIDSSGKTVLSWDDEQASVKGGSYVAKALSRNALSKISEYFTGETSF